MDANYEDEVAVDLFQVPDTTAAGQVRDENPQLLDKYEVSGIRISVRRVKEVHGTWSKAGDKASLLVLRFVIFKTGSITKKDRRVKTLKTILRFENDPKKDPFDDPHVKLYAPAPSQVLYYKPTTEIRSTDNERGVGASASAPAPGSPGVEVHWTYTASREYVKEYRNTIAGDSSKSGPKNSSRQGEDVLEWNMEENTSAGQKFGVASTWDIAAIIQRNSDDNFNTHVTFDAGVDWKHDTAARGKNILKLGFNVSRDPATLPATVVELPTGHTRDNLQSVAKLQILDRLAGVYPPVEMVVKSQYPASENKEAANEGSAPG